MPKGYDFTEELGYRLIQGRLGIYDKYKTVNTILDSDLTGVESQLKRLKPRRKLGGIQDARINYQGGSLQHDRMIADKRRSLDRALWYSYQGANVIKTDSTAEEHVRALINPNKLK